MIYLSDLITAIIAKIAGNTYLNGELGNQVTFGLVPQQDITNQTSTPYCAIYTVADAAYGSFGGTFLDEVDLQFSVWSTTFSDTSDLISEIGVLFNNASLTLADNTLVEMHRNSSIRVVNGGQDKNENFVYQGTVTFNVVVSGC